MNLMFEREKAKGLIRGVNVETNGLSLSHLQFADDTLIFCNNVDEVKEIKRILRIFQYMSGLNINFSKSMLYGVNVQEADVDVQQLAQFFGSRAGVLPIKY